MPGISATDVPSTASRGYQATSASDQESLPSARCTVDPIAVVLDFVGATFPDYEQLLRGMDLVQGGPGLPGCLFHWARTTQDGVRVIEVWRNRGLFDLMLTEELLPLVSYLRVPDPEVTFYDVLSFLTEGAS